MRRQVGVVLMVLVLTLYLFCMKAEAASKELVVLGFGGTYEKLMRTSVIPLFEQKFQAKVTYVGGVGSVNLAKVKLQASRPVTDILLTVDQTHVQGEAFGLFDRIDRRIVTNLKDVRDDAVRPGDLGVTFGLFAAGLEYNTRIFKEKGWKPPTSWYDLFRPELKGHVIFQSLSSAYGVALLAVIAKLEGGSEKDVEPGFRVLRTAAPIALTFTSAPAELDNLFSQGEAWMAVHSNLRTYPLKDRGAPVDFVLPKEGGVLMTNRAVVIKGAPQKELAQHFINHLLDPTVQKVMSEGLMYGPTNRLVVPEPKIAERVPYGSEQMSKFIPLDWVIIGESLPAWIDRWNREVERK